MQIFPVRPVYNISDHDGVLEEKDGCLCNFSNKTISELHKLSKISSHFGFGGWRVSFMILLASTVRLKPGIELLTRRTGYGGTALVLRLLHHAVLAYGFDEGADPENEC